MEWRKRIDSSTSTLKTPAMETALGRIARNLCYSHIMARKTSLAREETRQYGRLFPRNRVNSLFRIMATTGVTWWLWRLWGHTESDTTEAT